MFLILCNTVVGLVGLVLVMVYGAYQSTPTTALYKSLIGDSSIPFLVTMVLDLNDKGSVEEYRIDIDLLCQ